MKLRSGNNYTPENTRRLTTLLKVVKLLAKCDNAKTDIDEVRFTKQLYDYIYQHMDYLESNCFLEHKDIVGFYNMFKSLSEEMMDKIDVLLIDQNCTLENKTLLLDTMESISIIYYKWFPENDELENHYLNTYLED
jgi:hypothetical protein